MPENYFLNEAVSIAKSQERNEAFFPAVISSISPVFGAKEIPIYIYNTTQLELHDSRPPNHPHLMVKACPLGEPWVLAGQIQHPFPEIEYDQNGAKRVKYVDGFREATAMLSPLNPGTDQNFTSPDPLNPGGNWNDYGVFWSKNYPPTEEELAAARARVEKTFKAELAKMARIEAKNPDEAMAVANNVSHAAANYFGESTSWHRSNLIPKQSGKKQCWACGEYIQNAALICLHCHAPQDEEKRERWLEQQSGGRGPGRPSKAEKETD